MGADWYWNIDGINHQRSKLVSASNPITEKPPNTFSKKKMIETIIMTGLILWGMKIYADYRISRQTKHTN